jgi:hypothetical protein
LQRRGSIYFYCLIKSLLTKESCTKIAEYDFTQKIDNEQYGYNTGGGPTKNILTGE